MEGDETYDNNAENIIIILRPVGFIAGAAGCDIAFVALNPFFIISGAVFLSWLDTAA